MHEENSITHGYVYSNNSILGRPAILAFAAPDCVPPIVREIKATAAKLKEAQAEMDRLMEAARQAGIGIEIKPNGKVSWYMPTGKEV